jgi:hypothetical protein
MRAHPPDVDRDRMPANHPGNGDREPPRFEIRVRGPIGETLKLAFPALTASRHGPDTLLVGSLADQCALYGAIHQLEALGLQLLEVRRLVAHPDDEPAAPATPMDDEQGQDDV